MDGTSTKGSCYAHQSNIETTPQQVDNIQRLKMILESLPYLCDNIPLSHVLDQCYMLSKSTIKEFLKGGGWLDVTLLQLWCS